MYDAEAGLGKAPDAYAPVAGSERLSSLQSSEEGEPLQHPVWTRRVGIPRPAVLAAALATSALAAVALWGATRLAHVGAPAHADSATVARFEVEQKDTVFDAAHFDGPGMGPGPSTYAVVQQQSPQTMVVDQGVPATVGDAGYDGQGAPAMDATAAEDLAAQNAALRYQNELLKVKLSEQEKEKAAGAEADAGSQVSVSQEAFDTTTPQVSVSQEALDTTTMTEQEAFDATAVTQAPISPYDTDTTTTQAPFSQEATAQPQAGDDTRTQGSLSSTATDAGNHTPSSEVAQSKYGILSGSTAATTTTVAGIYDYATDETMSGSTAAPTSAAGIYDYASEAGTEASSMTAGGYASDANTVSGGTVTKNPWVEAAERLAIASSESTVTTSTRTTTPDPTSLFCFAVMMPHGYEVSLMKSTLAKAVGIFGCEEYTVLSSEDVELSPGPPVRIGTESIGSLKCSYGGPWHLALNSEIFVHAWNKIFEGGKYQNHAWTIKADPDAVFLSSRLRAHVRHSHPEESVYLNNCDQGLHGPIEVIGRGGMETFRQGMPECLKKLKDEFTWSGEDVFLRHCLGMLEVNRVDDFKLLSDKACLFEDPVSRGCVSGKVSFHPFKTTDSYFKCLKQAEGNDEH